MVGFPISIEVIDVLHSVLFKDESMTAEMAVTLSLVKDSLKLCVWDH
jgi:hypothetical protein